MASLIDDPEGHKAPLLEGHDGNRGRERVALVLEAQTRRVGALLDALWDSGVFTVSAAAVAYTFASSFVKLLGPSLPVFQIVAFRSCVALAICAAYARAARVSPFFGHPANLPLLLARGLFGAASMTTFYFAIKLLPLADAVTLFFLNPAVTALAAWAVMREPLGLRGAAGVVMSLAGLLLLTRPPFLFGGGTGGDSGGVALHADVGEGMSAAAAVGLSGLSYGSGAGGGGWDCGRLLGTASGVLSALLAASAFICIRCIGKSEPALVVSMYFHLCAAVSSLAPLAAGVPDHAVWPRGVQWALLLGVAAGSFWGQILIGRGFELLHAARASAVNFTQVVYAYVLGLLFLHERLTLGGGAGSALIALGVILVNLRPKKVEEARVVVSDADVEGAAASARVAPLAAPAAPSKGGAH